MNMSENEKAELLNFINSPLFKHACEAIAAKAASRTSFDRSAPDTGLLLALEKGVNDFPVLLRELTVPAGPEFLEGPPMPKSLRPVTPNLRNK